MFEKENDIPFLFPVLQFPILFPIRQFYLSINGYCIANKNLIKIWFKKIAFMSFRIR